MFDKVSESLQNLEELLNLDHDKDLLKRIENNEPISKAEYLYYEYSLPIKLMSLKMIFNIIERNKKNGC